MTGVHSSQSTETSMSDAVSTAYDSRATELPTVELSVEESELPHAPRIIENAIAMDVKIFVALVMMTLVFPPLIPVELKLPCRLHLNLEDALGISKRTTVARSLREFGGET
jgi:hypothetical protein